MSKIFISYRREDAAGYAISLHDRLIDRFGAEQIFMDIDSIGPGEDFVEVINEKIGACDFLLVLIGRDWVTSKDESGQRRLDNPDDFVRLEVTAALGRNIRVIPLLVGGAKPPKAAELPAELASLSRRNAVVISDVGFRQDVNRLIENIEKAMELTVPMAPSTQRSARARGLAKPPSVPPAQPVARSETTAGARLAERPPTSAGDELQVGLERVLRGYAKPVKTVAFSSDSATLASAGGGSWLGGGDTVIRLWRVSDGKLLRELTGHQDTVNKVAFSSDGDLLASCCSKAIHLWRAADGKRLRTLTGHLLGGGDDIAFCADGKTLECGHRIFVREGGGEYEWKVKSHLWSISDGKYLGERTDFSRDPQSGLGCVSFAGKLVATPELPQSDENAYCAVVIKRAADGRTIRELTEKDTGGSNGLAFSWNGRFLASSYISSPVLRLWRVADGKLLVKIEWPETTLGINNANGVAFAPDGKWVAVGCEDDKLVRLWPLL